ncbi:MAG: hypothetical protein ACW976_05745, partial [Candidatus Ranarchaeia archaeon]
MKSSRRVAYVLGFFFMFIFLGSLTSLSLQSPLSFNGYDNSQAVDLQDFSPAVYDTPWWDDEFHSRMPINFTEEDGVERTLIPADIYVEFDSGEARNNSIRVVTGSNVEISSQVWNRTYYPTTDYLQSATVTFHINVTANSYAIYWVYFTDQVVSEPS